MGRSEPAPGNRRHWPRYLSGAEVSYRPVDEPGPLSDPARVLNVSCGGISLRLDRPLTPGTVIQVDRTLPPEPPFAMLACVRHAHEAADSSWALGCSFIRDLDEEEVRRLL